MARFLPLLLPLSSRRHSLSPSSQHYSSAKESHQRNDRVVVGGEKGKRAIGAPGMTAAVGIDD